MSRIGKQPITIPQGVEVNVDGGRVSVKGPRGTLEQTFHPEVRIVLEDSTVR
ncbi:MAG TPA: 50S ribosomal protein L6, partial [Actinomycetota bacterium]|nr:50S ribosomal protein L6 [Actinomycetota bacterium]